MQRFLADPKTEESVDILRADNAKGLPGEGFRVCDQNKVKHEFPTLSNPELNGSAEENIAMMDAARLAARLHEKENYIGLPANLDSLWGEALWWVANDAFNRNASSTRPGMESPCRQYYGAEPEMTIRPFLRSGFTIERIDEEMSRVQYHVFIWHMHRITHLV